MCPHPNPLPEGEGGRKEWEVVVSEGINRVDLVWLPLGEGYTQKMFSHC